MMRPIHKEQNFNQKKILWISGLQIFPNLSGGQLRSGNICKCLAQAGYQVQIYSLTGRKADYLKLTKSSTLDVSENLKEYVNRNPVWGFIQFLFYQLHMPPLWLTFLTQFFLPETLKIQLADADQIIIDFPYLYPIHKFAGQRLILNTHNAEFNLWKNATISAIVKKIELKAIGLCSSVIFCSNQDRLQFLNTFPDLEGKSSIISNGVNLNDYKKNSLARIQIRKSLNLDQDSKVFLFTGSQFRPNLDAFLFLKNWASLNQNLLTSLKATIVIVGSVSSDLIDFPYFKVLGKVDQILPYFQAADFGLNAVTHGSGTNVKMYEYMASHLPLISTSIGARGLSLKDGESFLHFEAATLVEKVQQACQMPLDAREKMAQLAFDLNEEMIDMNKSVQKWLNSGALK